MLPVYDSVTMSVDENKRSFFRISQTAPVSSVNSLCGKSYAQVLGHIFTSLLYLITTFFFQYAPEPVNRTETPIYPVRSSPASIGTMEALGQHLNESFSQTLLQSQSLDISVQLGQVLYPNDSKLLTQVPIATAFDSFEMKQWLTTAQDPYFFQKYGQRSCVWHVNMEGKG